ncbi:hypothetical protein TNCV_1480201 [Trichonephila clavipes]|nr:hypothetical protein TNCV_1480201 [Trichonephila clavipes]
MRRELQRIGMHSRGPLRKPFLPEMQWCRERRHRSSEDKKQQCGWKNPATVYFAVMEDFEFGASPTMPLIPLTFLALCKCLVGVS